MWKRKVTGKLFVNLTEWSDVQSFENGSDEEVLSNLVFTTCDMTDIKGYSKAGEATVTVILDDHSKMVENKAESLRQEITKVRADSENQITRLTEKLNSLLAIAG